MAIATKDTLKSYFLTGNAPSQSNFDDFIDTIVALATAGNIVVYPSGDVAVNDTVGTDSGYNFAVTGSTLMNGTLNVDGTLFSSTNNSNNSNVGHLGGFTGTPTVAFGDGLGTLPSLSITGSDLNGQISATSGTATVGSARLFTVTFTTAYASTPNVMIQGANEAAAVLYGSSALYTSNVTTAGFDVWVANTPLTASTDFLINYFVSY